MYQITKTNVLTPDPEDPENFSIPIGEVRSRGIELGMNGEILPGWNIYASAFLSDPIISKSNDLLVGDTLRNSPRQGVSLWTTYEIQRGDYKGLGFGFGLFYVGDRSSSRQSIYQYLHV